MKNEIEVKAGDSPADMIRMAVTGGADLDKLEKLLALQERWEANEAKKAYHKAMAEFKANAPKIDKDKKVGYKTDRGSVGYAHASLFNVTDKISAELSKYGLSASWRTQQNGQIGVTCRISHNLGHYEETTLFAAPDTSGSKNSIQAIGSTVTYLQRYTLLALTGLATEDQDDDGKSIDVEVIDGKQISTLLDMITNTQTNSEKFLKWLGISSLEEMPKKQYQKALTALQAKEKKK